MREAVIVSTARTPIGKAYRGAFNDTQAQTLGGHAIAEALTRARIEGAEVDDVVIGAAMQQGSTGYNVGRQAALTRGAADQRRRHVGRPAMRLRPDGDFDRRQGDHSGRHERHGRRRARVDLARAERQGQQLPQPGPVARRASQRRLHVDARDRRDRRRALQDFARGAGRVFPPVAAAHRRGPGRRAVRAGDRAARDRDESHRQGDRRRLRQGGDAEAGRGPARRHDARRPRRAEARVRRTARKCSRAPASPQATPRSCPTARAPAC